MDAVKLLSDFFLKLSLPKSSKTIYITTEKWEWGLTLYNTV